MATSLVILIELSVPVLPDPICLVDRDTPRSPSATAREAAPAARASYPPRTASARCRTAGPVADREKNSVQLFTADGKLVSIWLDLFKPVDIDQDAAGLIYVTDQVRCMSQFAPDGKLLARCRPVLNGAHGPWGNAARNDFMAEMNPGRVTSLPDATPRSTPAPARSRSRRST